MASFVAAIVVNGGFVQVEESYRAGFRDAPPPRARTVRALAVLIQILGVLIATALALLTNLAGMP